MSATVMGAVMTCGPTRLRLCLALVGIADNADDFGFAQLSIATIASKARCDQRTAMRVVQALEREGWIKVYRRAVEGKGSVYIIDIAKLGVVPDLKSRKSQWHIAFERGMKLRAEGREMPESGDKVSPEKRAVMDRGAKPNGVTQLPSPPVQVAESGDILSPDKLAFSKESGDIPQGVQVTFCPDSGDISHVPILKNQGTIRNQVNPPPPLAGGASARTQHDVADDVAFEAEQRNWWETRNRIEVSEGRKAFSWDGWIADARRRRPQPAADPLVEAGYDAGPEPVQAAAWVLRKAALSTAKLHAVVVQALAAECERSGRSLPLVAIDMLRSYTLYAEQRIMMRWAWNERNFFADGHWLRPQSWPCDRGRSPGS